MRYCKKSVGLKLDPNKDLATVTQADIIENPKHLKFTEMKSPYNSLLYVLILIILSLQALSFIMQKSILNLHWQMKMYYHNGYYKS